MTWRALLLLALLGLVIAVLVAAFEPAPGYMDADYYYAGGRQLAAGKGFTEPYLWNYLDDPVGLPHSSNAYWMPMASLLAAAGGWLFGTASWTAARVGFLVVAAALPPLTAALGWSLTARRDLALTSGFLAVFPAFYLPFLPVTDTFGLYMLLGGVFFYLLAGLSTNNSRIALIMIPFLLGVIPGFMQLTRTDGLLWLLLAITASYLFRKKDRSKYHLFRYVLIIFFGYLIVMAPWYIRNIFAFGSPLAPGASRMFWLTSYDQLFVYPASQLTMTAWLQSGLAAILKVRLWTLGVNLATALSVQGEIFLLPLIGLGLWQLRRDLRIHLVMLAWLMTLGVMTVIFPFAGARGGFFHSGAALQTVWWAAVPLGLERVIEWGRAKLGWDNPRAGSIFRILLIGLVVCLTAIIVWTRVLGGYGSQAWAHENIAYSHISNYLDKQGVTCSDIVMVANPPGFYLASGNPSIAVPDGQINTILEVAKKYGAIYLLLEAGSTPIGLLPVYNDPTEQAELTYLGEVDGARIFRLPRH